MYSEQSTKRGICWRTSEVSLCLGFILQIAIFILVFLVFYSCFSVLIIFIVFIEFLAFFFFTQFRIFIYFPWFSCFCWLLEGNYEMKICNIYTVIGNLVRKLNIERKNKKKTKETKQKSLFDSIIDS